MGRIHTSWIFVGGLAALFLFEKYSAMLESYTVNVFPNFPYFTYFDLGLVIVGIIGFVIWLIKFKDSEHRGKKEFCRKIHEELKDGIESLNGMLDRTTLEVESEGKKIRWKHIFMNHAVYDSLVNSGDFNQVDDKLQQPIQDIYGKISIHDEYVRKMSELENSSTNVERYASILNGNEKELLKDIPEMMDKLKKYIQ